MPIARAPTYTKSTQLPSALSKRSKCVGTIFGLHQQLLALLFTICETYCCPVSLTCSDLRPPNIFQLVFLFSIVGKLSSCWLFKMDSCSCCCKEQSDWLKKHSASLVLKGHLFHPSNWTDSKYMTNLGLDNELMNSISCYCWSGTGNCASFWSALSLMSSPRTSLSLNYSSQGPIPMASQPWPHLIKLCIKSKCFKLFMSRYSGREGRNVE